MRRMRLFMYGCVGITTLNAGWSLARRLGRDDGDGWLDLAAVFVVIAAVVTWLAAVKVMHLQGQQTYHHDQIIDARRVVARHHRRGVPVPPDLLDEPDHDVNGRAWWEPGYIGPVGG